MASDADKAERRRTAIAIGLRLGQRIDEIENTLASGDHKAIMFEQLANEWVELLAEYPDIFPNPPISLETLRVHADELRRAADEAREAEAEYQEAQSRVVEAKRTLDATLNEIASPPKPEKPN